MGKRRNKYKYVDYSVIRRATEGDFDALEMVRKRYYAYMLKCVVHALSSLGHRTFRKDEIALVMNDVTEDLYCKIITDFDPDRYF